MQSDTSITSEETARAELGLPGVAVSVGGVRLSVSDPGGPGIPLLCLHAAGHGSGDFEPLRARVTPSARVITVDWPGHGRSGGDRVPADVGRYAELILELVDTLGLSRFSVLGCSVGGAVALRIAAQRPERVSALVLCNTGGLATPSVVVRGFCRLMEWAYRRGARGAWWFSIFFGLKYRVLLRGAAVARRRQIVDAGGEHASVLAQLWRSFGTPVNDVRGSIAQVRCPVWLAWARSDPFNNHRMIAASLRRFGTPLQLFAGGHAPFLEQPDAFAHGLLSFFEDHGVGARESRSSEPVAGGVG